MATLQVQIFGVKNSQTTRAAERFFKERGIKLHIVDLKQKPFAPGEIKRFIDRFGLGRSSRHGRQAVRRFRSEIFEGIRRRNDRAYRKRAPTIAITSRAGRKSAQCRPG